MTVHGEPATTGRTLRSEHRAEGEAKEAMHGDELLRALVLGLERLATQVSGLEEAIEENNEQLAKVRKQLSGLTKSVAKKKQLKKLGRLIDRIELIEGSEEPSDAS